MMKSSVLVTLFLAGTLCYSQASLTIRGLATGCFGGKRFASPSLAIYVYDVAKAERLIEVLLQLRLDVPDPEGVRYAALEARLIELVGTTPQLAITKTGTDGQFEVRIATDAKKLLVLGYAMTEEGPRKAFALTNVDNASTHSVIVDFSPDYPPPGACP